MSVDNKITDPVYRQKGFAYNWYFFMPAMSIT